MKKTLLWVDLSAREKKATTDRDGWDGLTNSVDTEVWSKLWETVENKNGRAAVIGSQRWT